MAYTRWDPRTRAGAVAVREKGVLSFEALSMHVAQWARYQKLSGEHDLVETSPITGNYDWRSYLQEEIQFAQAREARDKPREKKPTDAAKPAPPPSVFYA